MGKQTTFTSTVRVRWHIWFFVIPAIGVPVSLVFPSGTFGPVSTNVLGIAVISHTATGLAQVFVSGVPRGSLTAPGSITITI